MEYKISKEQCAATIVGVCTRCGGPLEPLETVDNSRNPTFWSGCPVCCCFDCGIAPEIYATAQKLVDGGYRHYSHISEDSKDDEETKLHKNRQHISGACQLVSDVLRIHGCL